MSLFEVQIVVAFTQSLLTFYGREATLVGESRFQVAPRHPNQRNSFDQVNLDRSLDDVASVSTTRTKTATIAVTNFWYWSRCIEMTR